jgi:hypothetical protein
MERELWPQLYHLIMDVGRTLRLTGVSFRPHIILLTFFWAALHERPAGWACDMRHWSTTTLQPARLPSLATVSRRLRRVDTAMLMRAVVQRLRSGAEPGLIALIDGKPLPISGSGHDPEARCGRGAGMWARGYKLYAIWAGRPVPETYRVYSMNINEDKVAEEMMPICAAGATSWATASTTPPRSSTRPGRPATSCWRRGRTRMRSWAAATRARTGGGAPS